MEETRRKTLTAPELLAQKAREELHAEFDAVHPAETIDRMFDESLKVFGDADVPDYVATLARRLSRDRLDANVIAAMAEVGVDLTDSYAKPLSTEVLGAANVVVTLGRSVGAVEIPETTRHEDWRVGDPVGASIDEVRRIRSELEARVDELLERLGVRV